MKLNETEIPLCQALMAGYPSGKGRVCKTRMRGFDSHSRLKFCSRSLVERRPPSKRIYAGSNPAGSAGVPIAMENPSYHPKWQAAVDAAKANPATRERVEAIIEEKMALPPDWSSKLKQIYNACVAEGLIKE